MLDAGKIVVRLQSVCPLDSDRVWIGNPADKATWNVPPHSSATTQQKAALLSAIDSMSTVDRVPRSLWDVYADLLTLTATQKNAIWDDLTIGPPANKIKLDTGPHSEVGFLCHFLVVNSGLAAAAVGDAKARAAAAYVVDNPTYLVNPSFAPTINIPGDQPVS